MTAHTPPNAKRNYSRTFWESFWEWTGRISGAVGILGFFGVTYLVPADSIGKILVIYICGINVVLGLYIFYVHLNKRHRYADILLYTHAVNHAARDWYFRVKKLRDRNELRKSDLGGDFDDYTVKMLDQIAEAFTYINGRKCSVCIKEICPDLTLMVKYRDSQSKQIRGLDDGKRAPFPIASDTPCHSLYATKHPRRYYACNNVVTEWDKRLYDSPTFSQFPAPNVWNILGYRVPIRWPLYYRSCLVVPIRYASCDTPPPATNTEDVWHYWGFLCIDCNSRNVFDFERTWYLAATFADVLFVHFSHSFGTIQRGTNHPIA